MSSIDELVLPIERRNPLEHRGSPIYAEFNSMRESMKGLNNLPPIFQKLYFEIVSSLSHNNFGQNGAKINPSSLIEEDFFQADGVVGWYKTRFINGEKESTSHQNYFYPGKPPHFSPMMSDEIEEAIISEEIFQLDNTSGLIKGMPRGYSLIGGLNNNSNFAIQLYNEGKRQFSEEKRQLFNLFVENINSKFDTIRDAKVDKLLGLINQNKYFDLFSIGADESLNMDGNYSVVLMDLDHFKNFNDTYGHPTGDKVLNTLGYIVNESVREHDLPARYGGEELVMLIRGGIKPAQKVVERIRQKMAEKPFVKDDGTPITDDVTISAGIYSTEQEYEVQLREDIPDFQSRLKAQVKMADDALYNSKETGRNRVSLYCEKEDSPQLELPFNP